MGRKGLWDLAEQDVREALHVAVLSGRAAWPASSQDRLAAVFDETSVGLSEFVNAARFHRLLRETFDVPPTKTMCRIFSALLRTRAREAMLGREACIAMSLIAALACIAFVLDQVTSLIARGHGVSIIANRQAAAQMGRAGRARLQAGFTASRWNDLLKQRLSAVQQGCALG